MKLSELQTKDIIRDEDGVKLGKITDVTIDVATGKVLTVSINNGFRWANIFSSKDQFTIPWEKIVKVGNDIIIVDSNHKKQIEEQNI